MSARSDTRVQFRNAAVADALAERAEPSARSLTAARDLERYYALLGAELSTLDLSEAEAGLVADALNGILLEPHTMRLLWANVADAIRLQGLDRKWGVDGEALVEKLRALTPGQIWALADAAERFWVAPAAPTAERLRQVGLVR